ncbi:MAG TPA: NADH-quinone oxidoreductase subunit L [Gemmatimonadales bacterium]|nr:NADH-quinone oxidoreductase subunit L [Gemmatimonadales bacterium]
MTELAGSAADRVGLAILLPFLGFLVNGAVAFLRPQAKRLVSVVGVGSVAAAFAVAVAVFLAVLGARPPAPYVHTLWTWIATGDLQVDLALQVDQLSVVMLLVVTGVSSLIHVFSIGYMRDDPGYARYFAYLNLFVAFMVVLVLGASFPVMFIGWEGVGLCSYLLIGFWFEEREKADAGLKAFLVNRIGDFGFLVAMFLIFSHTGTLEFRDVFARAPHALAGGTATAIALFLFMGCVGKSAQIPLYVWLPDAMAGPTPVSALIHAATMVTAGVYLVARCNVLFAMSPTACAVVAGVGALTALFAATIGLKQWDIKKVLAYSTVSQLGYMFVGVGVGAYAAGVFHLVTHAFFKALLFLGAGSVIHVLHRAYHHTHRHADAQDMRNMGGLAAYLPWTSRVMWVATLAIAGIPPLAGFFSKDEILGAAFARGAASPFYYLVWAFGLAAAFLTAFYMARLMLYTFHGPNRTGDLERPHLAEAPWVMTWPLVVLAGLTVLGGALNLPHVGTLHRWLEPVTEASAPYLPTLAPATGVEITLMVLAAAIGVGGIWLATRVLKPAALLTPERAPAETGFAKLLLEKYRVDELYRAVIVRPLVWLARVVLWKGVDAGVIDTAGVNGSAAVARGLGWIGSRLQTGQVGTYVVLFVVGAAAVLAALLRFGKP